MGTKDLCLRLLRNMNIEVHEADDMEDTYYFEYYGEHLSVRMNNKAKFIVLYDTFWKKYPAGNLEMVSLARNAVNRANIAYNGFKLFYTFVKDTMWIHCNTCELLIPEIPGLEDYFKGILESFLYSHKAFDDVMFELMEEEGKKGQ